MFWCYTEDELDSAQGIHTAQEILQQPEVWTETLQRVYEHRNQLATFLDPLLARHNLRIILTGAGSSAFAGRILAPYLREKLKRRVEAIASTDLVTSPCSYLAEDCPTLIISFARSGNSPESLAAILIANQLLTHCAHLVLSCNKDGHLHQQRMMIPHAYSLLMPPKTDDQGFAMTSSLSSMLVACLAIFLPDKYVAHQRSALAEAGRHILSSSVEHSLLWNNRLPLRVIYLASGCLQGVAQEAALKLLELTSGHLVAIHDSPAGFRHGPKSLVTTETLVILMVSNDHYTRQYDLDLLEELRRDNVARRIVALAGRQDPRIEEGEYCYLPLPAHADDADLALCYLLYAQFYAFATAMTLGITPDNPSPSGLVNRVVQGVTIYPYPQPDGQQ